MKNITRTILSLILVIVFLVSCILLITVGYTAAWLHTYQAFTDKTPVAEVSISEQKKDNLGTYVDVSFTPIQTQSALLSVVNPTNAANAEKKQTVNYKLYGDVVYVSGPIVKFQDNLILLNFKTIYKVGKIYARYDYDNELEKNRTPAMASTYDINGGFAEWKSIHDNLTSNTPLGAILRMFIDTTEVSSPGMFTNNRANNYVIYITNTGFVWELK